MNTQTSRTEVLVLMGGPDAEREVSLQSGREVANALRECGQLEVIEAVIDAPRADEIDPLGGDVIFPVLHGQWGEGGPLQRELDALGKPYIGSGAKASALAMDKLRTKTLLARDGVRTPVALELGPDDSCRLETPLVLKPVDDGSSVDIRICRTPDDVTDARRALHPRRARLMAEQYIPGRELTVGIVASRLLPMIEIVPRVDFYDYDAKYDRDDTAYTINPDLPADVMRDMLEWSMLAWERIGCLDVARIDYRLDGEGRVWFLEINTMPGFTTHSLVPMAARAAGMEMPELCATLVEAALKRSRTHAEVAL